MSGYQFAIIATIMAIWTYFDIIYKITDIKWMHKSMNEINEEDKKGKPK